ncbi:hypothetical protein [Flavobacterium phycosphaerae]|uniref:hypothetical protein n=1 Tax=Flavobacterium phycosphaerae TaxID=2697515 RepID=UPI001389C1C4|nr:hypothetical protein [Flavobacterium phycosphaerae]
MKTSITFLGLVALLFTTNSKAASEFKTQDLNQQEVTTVSVEDNQQSQQAFVNQEFSKITFANNSDETTVFDPNTVIKTNYTKTIEDVIAENKLITESQEVIAQPLSLEKTFEDYINEANQIIESTVTSEVYPLDFEKINRSVKSNKISNNNIAVSVDLKL